MDGNRFDSWIRNRALRLSRRDALRLASASAATTALGAAHQPALAQSTCSLTLQAEIAAGTSAPTAYDGTLQFSLGSDGGFDQATFTPASGAPQAVTGQATGRAIDFQVPLGSGQVLSFSGAGDQTASRCQGAFAGILSGPQPGDIGAWQATATTSTAAPPSTSNQSTANQPGSNVGSDSSASCPAGQARCNGTCIDTQTDPQNCGNCGTACDSGECNGGVCASGQTCTPDGGTCNVPADCCSLLCPHDPQAPGICGCSQIGGVCRGQDDCCQQGGDTLVACLGGADLDRCIVVNGACTSDSDCLSRHCVNGMCSSSSCHADGEPCQSTSDCCNPGCFGGVCGCARLGQSCSEEVGNEFFCCEGTPVVCFAQTCCIIEGSACSADADCCDYIQANGFCTNGVCTRSS